LSPSLVLAGIACFAGVGFVAVLAAMLLLSRDRQAVRLALADSNARLDRSEKDKCAAAAELESFSYTVAHDLRAPLRAIDGFSRALIEEFSDKLEPEAARLLGIVRRNSLRMGTLMDDLLAFSRLSRQPLVKHRVDPAAIVRRLLDDSGAARAGRDVAIEIGMLPPCEADPTLLTRVYAELIDNAMKFTAKADGARVEIGSRVEGGRAVYVVADNGVGFDMAYASKLFGVFQRLHRAEDFDGTGVGLAIAQRIVHRHGGEMWAEAAPDRGAAFFFTLGE
jgi:light-regulated signal transduction histidine kinase (bacteriophytochrome)